MAVLVSLERLLATPGTEALWPEEFAALVAKLADDVTDRAQWAIIAGWCEERDEHDLAKAFLWVSRRANVWPVCVPRWNRVKGRDEGVWSFNGLPPSVLAGEDPEGDCTTLAGSVAALSARLRRVRQAVETDAG